MKYFLMILLILLFAVISCQTVGLPDVERIDSGIYSYGNGVYFFPYVGDDFGKLLSKFVEEHRDTRVVSISSYDDVKLDGSTAGYFVVTESSSR